MIERRRRAPRRLLLMQREPAVTMDERSVEGRRAATLPATHADGSDDTPLVS